MDIQNKAERRQERCTYLMIVASCLCLVIQLYAIPQNHLRLMSFANRGLLLIWLVMGGIRIARKLIAAFPVKMASFLGLLGFTLLALLIAFLRNSSRIGTNLTAFVNFIVLPMMLLYTTVYAIPERTKKVLTVTAVLLSLIFMGLYFSNLRHLFTGPYGNTYLEQVTLGYNNPNQAAMYLFVCIMNLVIGAGYVRPKAYKALLYLDAAFLCWIMIQTGARTAILLMGLFFVLAIIVQKRKLPKMAIHIVVFAPFVYAVLAMFFFAVFGDIKILGESLFNGRENIFARYLSGLSFGKFLFGDYNQFYFQNLHNAYVSIGATAGIVAAVSHMLFIRKCLVQNYEKAFLQKPAAVAFCAALCLVAYTCTEAAFFVGGSTFAFCILTVVLFFSQPFLSEASRP